MNDPTNTHRIRAALDEVQVPVPGAVVDYVVRTGLDSTSDPAVWVYVVVDDDKIEQLWDGWRQLRWDIREAVAGVAGPEPMTYIRMWGASSVQKGEVHAP